MSADKKQVAIQNHIDEFPAASIKWDTNTGDLLFNGIDSVLFWSKPSLASILLPLREEVGEALYSCLIAFEASRGTDEDYFNMIAAGADKFADGFAAWAVAVTGAGWGRQSIEELNWEKREAVVRVENPWELRLFQSADPKNNVPFIRGKLSGIFSLAFKANVRATVTEVSDTYVRLTIRPSVETLEQALSRLQSEEHSREKEGLKAINNALRRNERRLLDVAETVGDFIWESDRHLNITHITEQSIAALGLSAKEVIGRNWSDLLGEDEADQFWAFLAGLDDKRFVEGEFALKLPNGTSVPIFIRAKSVLDHNGNRYGYIGSGRDISVEKQLQEQLYEQKRSNEYASKMATLGEMAAGIAHEINTPLSVISLLAEQLVANLSAGDASQDQKDAESILSTVERISEIIQGLKTFARDARGDEFVSASPTKVVQDTAVLCANRLKSSHIGFEIHVEEQIGTVRCRPTQLSQVLLNLLNNAHDAVSAIPEKWIRIHVTSSDGKIFFRVTDSGRGIPAAACAKLMQPFFTTKPAGKGTGLGLSISKSIVEVHGGRLYYDPQSERTSFVVELPMEQMAF